MHVRVVPLFVDDIAECASGVVGQTSIDFIDENTTVRVSPETAFISVNAHSHRISA